MIKSSLTTLRASIGRKCFLGIALLGCLVAGCSRVKDGNHMNAMPFTLSPESEVLKSVYEPRDETPSLWVARAPAGQGANAAVLPPNIKWRTMSADYRDLVYSMLRRYIKREGDPVGDAYFAEWAACGMAMRRSAMRSASLFQ